MIQDKIIIYGYNNLGYKIAALLKIKSYNIIVVDFDKDRCEFAKNDGFEVYNYSLMNDEELIEIGIESVKAFFCVSKSEQNNLFVTLSVRNLNKSVRIISTAKTKEDNQKMILAGATKVINPYELGALRILKLLHKPLILEILDDILFSNSELNVAEFTVTKQSLLNGKFLYDFDFSKEYDILIIGIADKELGEKFIFNAKGINHKIDEGDILVAMGYREQLEKFKIII